MSAPTVLISAGEASSDMYAARIVKAMRERTGAHFFGMGGPRMAEAGVELIADYHDVAVVGIAEVLHKIPAVVRVQNLLAREAARRKASLAVLVDSPGTHLGVARRLKNRGIPVGYFIGPQVWAWRPGRVRVVKRLVKRMVVIFPFEEQIYRDAGVPVSFVGHPLADVVHASMTRAEFAAQHKLDAARPIVAILPGSRRKEIAQHYRTILEACGQIARQHQQGGAVQFVNAAAPGIDLRPFAEYERSLGIDIRHIEGAAYDVLASSDCAIVASGTATVEAALLGTPMVVIYRVAPLTASILRHMVRTRDFGMVNLIAGLRLAPELIQDDFTPSNLASEIGILLDSETARNKMKSGLVEIRQKLGSGGAIDRAAEIFSGMLQNP
ncbi:MAG TPA: lipid-A-disaccharide synthase [Candidatus Dormibacteraeota bacterium]|nr:lipid-A-disaccharide synthase [Candidatus Dormibacteraeota bacterium]